MKYPLLLLLPLIACVPIMTASPSPGFFPEISNHPSPTADFEMVAAFSQANATLDEFIRRIAVPNTMRTFVALKVRFMLSEGFSQDIWCDDVTFRDDQFTGNMGDDIPALKLAFDERIAIPIEDIVDWMIVENDKLIGGFTIRLAYSRMTQEEKLLFLLDAGYSVEE